MFVQDIKSYFCKTCKKIIDRNDEKEITAHTAPDHIMDTIQAFDITTSGLTVLFCYKCEQVTSTKLIELVEHENHLEYVGLDHRTAEEKQLAILETMNGENQELDVELMASEIIQRFYIKTIRETGESYIYKNGIYVPDTNSWYVSEICERLGKKVRTGFCNEVINKIKRNTLCNISDFDVNDNILNVWNGLYDFETNTISQHTPLHLSMIQIPVTYDPQAVPRKFLAFLKQCLPEPKSFFMVLEGFAACLLKNHSYQKAFMFIGTGANGKSTFLDIMVNIIGKKNTSFVSIHDLMSDKFASSELTNKMINIFSDVEGSELKHTGILKAIISGDGIKVQKKYQNAYSIINTAKLFFSANRFPEVLDQSNALFRRFMIVDWNISFLKKMDIMIKSRIIDDETERSGIFNILLGLSRGLRARGKFQYDDDIEYLRRKWNERADPIRKFIDEEIVQGEEYEVGKMKLYERYHQFCLEKNIVFEGKITFYSHILELTGMRIIQQRYGTEREWVFQGGTIRQQLRKENQTSF